MSNLQEKVVNILEASDHDVNKTYRTEANEVISVTLKAVGEWLEKRKAGEWINHQEGNTVMVYVHYKELEILKRGEMPGEKEKPNVKN